MCSYRKLTMKTSEIFKHWNSFLNESEAFSEDPNNFDNTIFSRKFNEKKLDKTNLNEEEIIKELSEFLIKYNKFFISFVDKYDENIPRLSVNPNITYDTPHGVYAYPLTKEKFYQFLVTGNPTQADFATNKPYFHVYLLKDIGSIKLEKDHTTNYNDKNYSKDFKTITKLGIDYFVSLFENNENLRSLYKSDIEFDDITQLTRYHIKEINESISGSMFSIVEFFADMSLKDEYLNIDSQEFLSFCRYLESYIYARLDIKRRNQAERSKFYMLFFLAHTFTRIIGFIKNDVKRKSFKDKSITDGMIAPGGLYTLLLSSVNIDSIDDSAGTSTVHESEPSQAVSIDISNADNTIFLGTYKNHIYDSVQKIEAGEISVDERNDYITSLMEKGIIDSRTINFEIPDW